MIFKDFYNDNFEMLDGELTCLPFVTYYRFEVLATDSSQVTNMKKVNNIMILAPTS